MFAAVVSEATATIAVVATVMAEPKSTDPVQQLNSIAGRLST